MGMGSQKSLAGSIYILFPSYHCREAQTERPRPLLRVAVPRRQPVGPVPTVLTVRRPIPTAPPVGLHGLPIPIPGFWIESWLQNSLR